MIQPLNPDDLAPLFTLPDQDGNAATLSDYNDQWVVLFFYPKNDTPGWTQEARDFTDLISRFAKLDASILGVSPDSQKSHAKFITKYDLKVRLLSDPDHVVMEQYGVWRLKKMYGREFIGVVRSTFLINPQGVIAEIWNNVRVKGHAEKVYQTLDELT